MEISHTNWNLYRNFVLLCETQNMHKAAELCGITRSGISHNITELERQLGKNLFITSTKGVEPTSEAMSLYPSIKSAISIITDAENGLEVFNEISEAIIKIGVAPSILNAKLSKYIAQFTRQYKNVSFVFFDRNSLDLLNQKKLDFHIRSEFVVKGHEYKTIDLFTDELVFIASQNFVKEHKLKTKLSFDEIKNEKIIASQYIANELAIKPDILTSTGDSIVSLVRNGAGIGILWKHHIDVTNENNFIQLSVNDAPSTITFSVAYYPRHISKAAQIFLAGLIDHCKS